ncbi:MAG TPA: low temperature requirement protein A [Pseudonocardiaceae bacterium]|nr:low temperature requirement protein A [Pseudonocardiaceae bacterium]
MVTRQPGTGRRSRLLRLRVDGQQRVTNVELFFDLVYVFAVTQITRFLGEDLSWQRSLQALLLLFALWWAWIYTAWVTNWLHPDARAVRACLLAVMLASLIVSATLPEAFGDRGLIFAVTYVVMQLGRTAFVVYAVRRDPVLRVNFVRIMLWLLPSGACWVAGGLTSGTTRDALWAVAVLIDFVAPALGFAVPGLGRSTTREWNIAGDHLAERCQLFMIIALGESILDIGTTFGDGPMSAAKITAFVLAFLGTVALWWVYFDRSAEDSSKAIASSPDPGRLGRSAYTYFHLPMVAGVIVTAVADEQVIAHPTGHGSAAVTATVLGGPALYLFGHLLFKRAVFRLVSWPRLIALLVLAACIPLGAVLSPLALSGVSGAIVVAVVVADLVQHPVAHPDEQPV